MMKVVELAHDILYSRHTFHHVKTRVQPLLPAMCLYFSVVGLQEGRDPVIGPVMVLSGVVVQFGLASTCHLVCLLAADMYSRGRSRRLSWIPVSCIGVSAAWVMSKVVAWMVWFGPDGTGWQISAFAGGVAAVARAQVVVLTGEAAAAAVGKGSSAGRWAWLGSLGGALAGYSVAAGEDYPIMTTAGTALAMIGVLQASAVARRARGAEAWVNAGVAAAVASSGTASAISTTVTACAEGGKFIWIGGGLGLGLCGPQLLKAMKEIPLSVLMQTVTPVLMLWFLYWLQYPAWFLVAMALALGMIRLMAIAKAETDILMGGEDKIDVYELASRLKIDPRELLKSTWS